MNKLADDIVNFFNNQGFVIVSTVDANGNIHNSCKGIVHIAGDVYLLDLYQGKTFKNLKINPHISITAVDEHKFKGFCLQGKARIIAKEKLPQRIVKSWENKISSRLTHRLLKNIHGEKGHPRHPEMLLPKPSYLISMEVNNIIDLTPHHIKQGG